MTSEPLTLNGCAPTPLASYLKGPWSPAPDLVARQPCLRRGRPIRTHAVAGITSASTCERRSAETPCCASFCTTTRRGPIIAPWNGRAGFLEDDAGEEVASHRRPS